MPAGEQHRVTLVLRKDTLVATEGAEEETDKGSVDEEHTVEAAGTVETEMPTVHRLQGQHQTLLQVIGQVPHPEQDLILGSDEPNHHKLYYRQHQRQNVQLSLEPVAHAAVGYDPHDFGEKEDEGDDEERVGVKGALEAAVSQSLFYNPCLLPYLSALGGVL